MKFKDLTGKRFGRLVVVSHEHRRRANGRSDVIWSCHCDCGGKTKTLGNNLTKGGTLSCGCVQKERVAQSVTTHGQSETRLYYVWNAMIDRCHNKKVKGYEYYGARGISVCARWRKSFQNFAKDIGPKPSPSHSIDRINNNGNYEPKNVRWATPSQQVRNRRPWGAVSRGRDGTPVNPNRSL